VRNRDLPKLVFRFDILVNRHLMADKRNGKNVRAYVALNLLTRVSDLHRELS